MIPRFPSTEGGYSGLSPFTQPVLGPGSFAIHYTKLFNHYFCSDATESLNLGGSYSWCLCMIHCSVPDSS